MQAKDETASMIRWFSWVGIDRTDLAVRRTDGTMLWHRNLPVERLPLDWVRAENVRGADAYVRPVRTDNWPVVFLDDVPIEVAHRVGRKYAALVVHTSAAGGCHIWVLCQRCLDEQERAHAQRWIASRVGADLGSTSGEHLGRLAGFKNWKRGGTWVNVLMATGGLPWDPAMALGPYVTQCVRNVTHCVKTIYDAAPNPLSATGRDTSESGREWGWVCGLLESGVDRATICHRLTERARPRRGADAERYARHTVARAAIATMA